MDSLVVVGAPTSVEDHIEVILLGLNKNYSAFITTRVSRSKPYSINEIEALLMDQEKRIERFRSSVQAIISQLSVDDKKNGGNTIGVHTRGHGRGRGHSRGGRSQLNNDNRPQCRLFRKVGHVVLQCYHKFDQNFQAPNAKRMISNLPPPPPTSFRSPASPNPRAYLATPTTLSNVA